MKDASSPLPDLKPQEAAPVSTPLATIILPTTGDRWPLVEQALWSLARQTVTEYEVFVIGDGVAPASGEHIVRYCESEPRARFFSFPKGASRGETSRHEALAEARGVAVFYLCDRDLYLPWHLERLLATLEGCEFSHSLNVTVQTDDSLFIDFRGDIRNPQDRRAALKAQGRPWGIPLSTTAHRLSAYRRLAEGWAPTPEGRYTDIHMWSKFLRDDSVRGASLLLPTVIYLPRGRHPGWPVDQRLAEMLRWRTRMEMPGFALEYMEQVTAALIHSRERWRAHPWRLHLGAALSSARLAVRRHTAPDSLPARTLDFLDRSFKPFKLPE